MTDICASPLVRDLFDNGPLRAIGCTPTAVGDLFYATNDIFIGRSIQLYGEWCWNEILLIRQFLREGDTVIDVGANIGHHTRAFVSTVGQSGSVVAIEPNQFNFLLLQLNCQTAQFPQAHLVHAAASSAFGFGRVDRVDPAAEENYGHLALTGGAEGQLCPVIQLDGLPLDKVSLVKIDVEGHELSVVDGAMRLIETCAPVLFVEADGQASSREIATRLVDRDYHVFRFDTPAFRSDNFKGNGIDIWEGRGYSRNMLCVPRHLGKTVLGLQTFADGDWQGPEIRRDTRDVRVLTT